MEHFPLLLDLIHISIWYEAHENVWKGEALSKTLEGDQTELYVTFKANKSGFYYCGLNESVTLQCFILLPGTAALNTCFRLFVDHVVLPRLPKAVGSKEKPSVLFSAFLLMRNSCYSFLFLLHLKPGHSFLPLSLQRMQICPVILYLLQKMIPTEACQDGSRIT